MGFQINPIVNWLLSHAYGQGGAVAVPYSGGLSAPISRGPFPPGVTDVLNHITSFYGQGQVENGQPIQWCFLVGGPGNGKSEALRELASMLGIPGILPVKRPGQPVPRTVPQDWETNPHLISQDHGVAFINDASIPRNDADPLSGPGSLFLDLRSAFQNFLNNQIPLTLLVNVNRGIIVEEANALQQSGAAITTAAGKPAEQIIRWLASPPTNAGVFDASPNAKTVVPITPLAPYYGQLEFTFDIATVSRKLCIHVVFLDTLSMLEPTPTNNGATINFSSPIPQPAKYNTLGSLLARDVNRDATTAGQFVASIVNENGWSNGACKDASTGQLCEAYMACPFAQNTRWLQQDALRHRFLDTLRAAEVAAGKRFTYRELLEHISLAILGKPEPDWLSEASPCNWVKDRIQQNSKEALFLRASHRIYVNLFAVGDTATKHRLERPRVGGTVFGALRVFLQERNTSARPQAFARAFTIIDPARDTDSWGGIRSQVLDAVESLDVINPSDQIRQWAYCHPEMHSDIEQALDQVFREEIATELHQGSSAATNRVRILRYWRSLCLLRQVGLSQGNLAFGEAIQGWLEEQEIALRNAPMSRLGEGISRLIMPSTDGKIFLAPLRPRTYCLTDSLPKETILTSVSANDLQVVIISYGDTLLAEVQANRRREHLEPLSLATLVVDLSIAREALLHSRKLNRSFTEIGHTAFARIERARASLVSRARSSNYPMYFTDDLQRVFLLTPSPGSAASVRVQAGN